MKSKGPDICKQGHRGVLFHMRDHSDLSKGCKVTVVLKKNCLKLLRGNKEYKKIDLEAIETPIHIVPNDQTCIAVKHAQEKPDILCCDNTSCRDEWWTMITKQILCLHQGAMRNEVAGDPPVEVEQREVLEKVIEEPEKGGITIHIDKGQMPKEPTLAIHPRFQRGLSASIAFHGELSIPVTATAPPHCFPPADPLGKEALQGTA
ncbi:uncharacterized protein LOC113146486 [Cyclospora cayetanensis]|uniref:Uncharacterized protein LOC113146486 n=1 Tax=Cyclospora cayetanensis TaxID=88456 RepID=A0A6P6RRL7_9EIME|nr:uncharacterized protein LOC113146486 [Cyclospora cayetanensis]